MIEKDRRALAVSQVNKYWVFLQAGFREDVDQVIDLTLHECVGSNTKDFSNTLNRNLYRLARDMGFCKIHMDYHTPGEHWWVKKETTQNFVLGVY